MHSLTGIVKTARVQIDRNPKNITIGLVTIIALPLIIGGLTKGGSLGAALSISGIVVGGLSGALFLQWHKDKQSNQTNNESEIDMDEVLEDDF